MKKFFKLPPAFIRAYQKIHLGLVWGATILPIVALITWYSLVAYELTKLVSPAWFHPGNIPTIVHSSVLSLTGYWTAAWLAWVLCYLSPVILPLFAYRMLKFFYFPALGAIGIVKHLWAVVWKKSSGRSKAIAATRTYYRFLRRYSGNRKLFSVIRTHVEFLPFFAFPPLLVFHEGTNLWHACKACPFELRKILKDIDAAIRKIAGEGSGISGFEEIDDGYAFNVREGKLSSATLISKLSADKNEIFRKLPGFKSNDSVFSITFAIESDTVHATVTRTPVWTIQDLNPASKEAEIPKGKILLGFSK